MPDELESRVVLNNVATRSAAAIQRRPRFLFHRTPTHRCWMNLIERWFAELTTKRLRRGAYRSVAELTRAVERWAAGWNADPRPFIRCKTADQIFDNPAGYLNRTPDSGH